MKCNEDVNEKVIRELKEEIEKLRQQLLAGGGGGGGGGGAGGDNAEAAMLQVSPAPAGVVVCFSGSEGELFVSARVLHENGTSRNWK